MLNNLKPYIILIAIEENHKKSMDNTTRISILLFPWVCVH